MFGYVTTNQEELKIKDFRRYQTFYCGLCRDLGDRHGQTARLTLTYDMTFLAVLLTGLYEPEERVEERFCPLHPAKKRLCRRNAAVSYAADMNLLLCYYNLLDDWLDEKKPVPLALAYGRAGPTEAARAPRQTGSPAQPQSPESEYVRSLPDWAQRFLRSSSAGTPAMGVAKDISSLPQPDHAVTWTAPDYRPPQAAIAYREKGGGGSPQTRQEVRVSDAEIQRTADKVYRMIEERLRRERRRLGF